MSKYTTEVRFICEQKAGLTESAGYNDVEKIIELARPKIFDFNYPIFDVSYKPIIETKILKHYYTREICAETVGLWQLWLNARMNEIMPYYNKLYESELFLRTVNMFNDTDYTTDFAGEGTKNGTKVGNNATQDSGKDIGHSEDAPHRDVWELFSDTPQGDIIAMDNDEYRYLTNATHTITSGAGSERDDEYTYGKRSDLTINEQTQGNTTDDYLKRVFGKVNPRSYAELFKELADNFINVDMLIINNLADLFFNLW